MARKYSNTAVETTLTSGVTSSDTTIVVGSTAGFPSSFPYTLDVNHETSLSEVVLVTGAATNSLTVTRGYGNTSAQAHQAGARVVHVVDATHANDMETHVDAASNVHGVGTGSNVVGTATTQTLTSKTISGSNNTLTALPANQLTGDYKEIKAVAQSATGVPVKAKGASGQTANLFEATDSADAVKFKVEPDGDVQVTKDLAITGNATVAAVSATSVSASGTVSGGALSTTGNIAGETLGVDTNGSQTVSPVLLGPAAADAVTAVKIDKGAMPRALAVNGRTDITGDLYVNGANGYRFLQTVAITATGNFEKASYTGLRAVRVRAWASGGGGGGASTTSAGEHSTGAGGGAGEYAEKWILAAALAATEVVTIGAAGAGAANAAGTAGGVTSFGSHFTVNGGSGGGFRSSEAVAFGTPGAAGGTGGSETVDLRVPGHRGGTSWGSASLGLGGSGADSQVGSGGGTNDSGASGGGGNGTPGTGYAAGGGGAKNNQSAGTARAGGAGAPGLVLIDVYV